MLYWPSVHSAFQGGSETSQFTIASCHYTVYYTYCTTGANGCTILSVIDSYSSKRAASADWKVSKGAPEAPEAIEANPTCRDRTQVATQLHFARHSAEVGSNRAKI